MTDGTRELERLDEIATYLDRISEALEELVDEQKRLYVLVAGFEQSKPDRLDGFAAAALGQLMQRYGTAQSESELSRRAWKVALCMVKDRAQLVPGILSEPSKAAPMQCRSCSALRHNPATGEFYCGNTGEPPECDEDEEEPAPESGDKPGGAA